MRLKIDGNVLTVTDTMYDTFDTPRVGDIPKTVMDGERYYNINTKSVTKTANKRKYPEDCMYMKKMTNGNWKVIDKWTKEQYVVTQEELEKGWQW